MSSVAPINHGPASQSKMTCPASHFHCYKDCCQRREQFCNHSARERRCWHCRHRADQCDTPQLPVECEAFCLKRDLLGAKSDESGQVSAAYQTSTLILAACVGVLLVTLGVCAYIIYIRLRNERRAMQRRDPSLTTDTEKLSLMESSLSGSGQENKETQTDQALHTNEADHGETTTNTTTSRAFISALSFNTLPQTTHCHDQSPSPAQEFLHSPESPNHNGSPAQLPTSDSSSPYLAGNRNPALGPNTNVEVIAEGQRREVGIPGSAQQVVPGLQEERPCRNGQQPARGTAGQTEEQQDTEPKTLVVGPCGEGGGEPPGGSCRCQYQCSKKVCKDPRLDNVPPSSEGERGAVDLHTNVTSYMPSNVLAGRSV